MKILLVHQSYPERGTPAATGGSELYTAALARALAREHEVSVLHRSADPLRADYHLERSEGAVRAFALNNRHRECSGFESYRDPRAAAAAARVMEQVRPELVHVGNLNGLSTGIVFEARRRGVPVVITLHDFGTLCPLGQLLDLGLKVCPGPSPRRCLGCVGGQVAAAPARLRGLARRLGGWAEPVARLLSRAGPDGAARVARRLEEMREVLRAADVLLSPSRFLRDRMAALGVAGIEFLPNGHEPLPPFVRTPDPQGRVRFGFVGTAIPSKGVHVLAEAFRLLDDPRGALRIHGAFVPYHGDTGYEGRIREILGSHAREALCGPFPHARLAEVLSGVDVLVVPSIWEENAPLVVQEALLAGLPLLATDHGGLAEAVREGIDGLRFRPGDPRALALLMRRMIEEPDLRQRLGSSPPSVPTMDEHVRQLAGLYEEACRRHGQRAGRVGVVVLDRGRPQDAARAARSARDPALAPRIVVVENGAGPESRLPPGVDRLILAENRGFAAGMNEGLRHLRRAGCDRFLLLNNDAVLEPGALRRLAEALADTGLGAVAPVVLRESDGRVESRGARFHTRSGRYRLLGHGEEHEAIEARESVEALAGTALMLSAAALDRVGGLEEAYFHSFEDADWCLRARKAGFGLAVVRGATARHAGSRTLGEDSPERLYYAARNHLRAAERALPLRGPGRFLRQATILALNLGHAFLQGEVPRGAGILAVLMGAADFVRGRFGPKPIAP